MPLGWARPFGDCRTSPPEQANAVRGPWPLLADTSTLYAPELASWRSTNASPAMIPGCDPDLWHQSRY